MAPLWAALTVVRAAHGAGPPDLWQDQSGVASAPQYLYAVAGQATPWHLEVTFGTNSTCAELAAAGVASVPVHIFLSEQGADADLGVVPFPVSQLYCPGGAASGHFGYDVDFGSPAVQQWLPIALADDMSWSALFILDDPALSPPNGALFEGGGSAAEYDSNLAVFGSFEASTLPRPLSGELMLGPTTATLRGGGLDLIENSFECDAGDLEVGYATIDVAVGLGVTKTIDIGSNAADYRFLCVRPTPSPSGAVDLVATTSGGWTTPPFDVSGTRAGLAVRGRVRVADSGLYGAPGLALAVTLPVGHSFHALRPGGGPQPRGSREVALQAGAGPFASLDLVTATSASGGFVSAERLPFEFEVEGLSLGATTLVGTVRTAHYRYAMGYHEWDDRRGARKGPRSNDAALAGVDIAQGAILSIGAEGLGVDVPVAAAAGVRTAFPEASVDLAPMALRVREGQIMSASPTGPSGEVGTVVLEQQTSCPECGNLAASPVTWDLSADAVGMGPDGALAARVTLDHGAAFGPDYWRAGAAHHVFERGGDVGRAAWALFPGGVATSTGAGGTVGEYLLGAWRVAVDGQSAEVGGAAPASDVAVKRGNGFFAGVTVGPETYSDASGQPSNGQGSSLGGATMSIAFGGPGTVAEPGVPTAVTASGGTKYVVRSGGISGAFNFTGAPQPTVYGFALPLSRFAFRGWMNALDATSWIDGSVSVGGRAGLSAPFVSLALQCTGHLSRGMVDRAHLSPQDLDAWRTGYDLTAIGFAAGAADSACSAAPRELLTVGALAIQALARPLSLEATWTAAGEPGTRPLVVTGDANAVLDTNGNGQGFPFVIAPDGVALEPRTAGSPLGWFVLKGKLLVPLWDALSVEARVENATTTTKAPTLVVPAGYARPASWSSTGNAGLAAALEADPAAGLRARYDWAVSVDLPVRWKATKLLSDPADALPRLVADRLNPWERELLVLSKVKAAVDYVTPERTRVSFGASADLANLSAAVVPTISVDLRDPASTARVDSFLRDLPLGITGTPVTSFVSTLRQPAEDVALHLGSMLDQLLKDAISDALDAQAQPGGLFALAADALSVVQSTPAAVTKGVFDGVRAKVDQAVGGLTAALDGLALALYQDLPDAYGQVASKTASPSQVAALMTLLDGAGQVGALVQGLATRLEAAETAIDQAKGLLASLGAKAQDAVTTAANTVDSIDRYLDPNATGSPLAILKCTPATRSQNPIVSKVDDAIGMATRLADALGNNTLTNLAQGVGALLGIDMRPIANATAYIKKTANTLGTKIKDQVKPLVDQLCNAGGKLAELTQKARQKLVTPLKQKLAPLKTQLGNLVTNLSAPLDAAKKAITKTRGSLRGAASAVAVFVAHARAQASTTVALQVPPGYASHAAWARAQLDGAVVLADPALGGWVSGGVPFTSRLADRVAQPLYDLIALVETQVGGLFTSLMQDVAFPTAGELRDHVLNLIMQSPVMEMIDQLLHEGLALIGRQLGDLTSELLDQANALIREAIEKGSALLRDTLDKATSSIKNALGFCSAKLDGYAVLGRETIERLHIGAEFALKSDASSCSDQGSSNKRDNASKFSAALDVTSWTTNGKAAACLPPASPTAPGARGAEVAGKGIVDAVISARDLPFKLGPSDARLRQLWLGFTFDDTASVLGVAGGFETAGSLDFKAFQLKDVAFAAGVGKYENYLGARATAKFQKVGMQVAFLVGRTCNKDVLEKLDPQVASFVKLPASGAFEGVYVRGGASFPVLDYGCALSLGVTVEVGTWLLFPDPILGVYLGGAIYGTGLCLAALKGGLKVATSIHLDSGAVDAVGLGWCALGIGFCEPEDWWSVEDSRDDSWCATFDASFGASYDDGSFSIGTPSFSGPH